MKNKKIWLIFFFLLAFAVRFWLATIYTPVGGERGIADQLNYEHINHQTMEGGYFKTLNRIITRERFPLLYVRTVNLILTPIMLIGRLLGLSDLTGTIAGGCFIGALSIIPLWFISERLKINPMMTCFLYVFAPLDIAEVLTWGGYSLLFGMLSVNVYVWLVLWKRHWLTGLVLLPVILTHYTSILYISVFVTVLALLSLATRHWKSKISDARIPFEDSLKGLKPWLVISLVIVYSVLFWEHGHIFYGYLPGKDYVPGKVGLETHRVGVETTGVSMIDFRAYLFIAGPFALMLALIGLKPFLRQNRGSILLLSWVFLPHLLTFVPLFDNPIYSLRLTAFGAGGMSVLGCYALKDWKKKDIWKTVLIALLFLSITKTIIHSVLAFGQYGI